MIRILHVVSSLEYGGGVQTVLYNYYNNIKNEDICFDFIVHGHKRGKYEELFEAMGSKIIHVTPKKISIIKNIKEIDSALSMKDYDIVHTHQNLSSGIPLLLAKLRGIPIRISHSHGYKKNSSLLQTIQELPLRSLNNIVSNYKFACGKDAGKWLFGDSWEENERNIIMYNAIDLSKYFYNQQIRQDYRRRLNLHNKFAMIHVGRLSDEKNQEFSIEILEKILSIEPNTVLLLVGAGDNEEKLRKIVKKKGLNNHIKYLGIRNDVSSLMNAADILLLPSINEGLGMVAVEAQICKLKVLASDNVPKATKLSNLIEYLPLDNNINVWIEKIINSKLYDRNIQVNDTKFNNYSITVQAQKYEEWIRNKVENNRRKEIKSI